MADGGVGAASTSEAAEATAVAADAAAGEQQQQQQQQLSDALLASLQGVVPKADVYLIKAAQASTLRQLKAARKQLRDFNAAARHELDAQLEGGRAAVGQLLAVRADLDATFAALRCIKQQLAEHRPDLYKQLQQELAAYPD